MRSNRKHTRALALLVGATSLSLLTAGCATGPGASSETEDVTITVALFLSPPPKASLDAFTEETGITVNWTTIDWDSLQTKITAAATAKTYFADATDVDWSAGRGTVVEAPIGELLMLCCGRPAATS